jgi:hypothetical protein
MDSAFANFSQSGRALTSPPACALFMPRSELELIDRRFKRASEDYEQWSKSEKPKSR